MNRRPSGFTLLEVLVALLILSMLSGVLARLIITSVSARDKARELNGMIQTADTILQAAVLAHESGIHPELDIPEILPAVHSAGVRGWRVTLRDTLPPGHPGLLEIAVSIQSPQLSVPVTLKRLVRNDTQ